MDSYQDRLWACAHGAYAQGPSFIFQFSLSNEGPNLLKYIEFEKRFLTLHKVQNLFKPGLILMVQVLVTSFQDKTISSLLRYSSEATVYAIWHERNARRVEELLATPTRLITSLDKLVWNRIPLIREKRGKKARKSHGLLVCKPMIPISLFSPKFYLLPYFFLKQ